MLAKVEGIVIRATDYGEGNRILTVLTKQSGKMSMMARGAKKPKSRFAALSQPFTCAEFVIFRSSSRAMGTINSGELIHSHHTLREDLMLSAYAAYMAELVNRLTTDGDVIPGLYDQLLAAFRALEEGKDAEILTHVIEMNMLAVAGFMPELYTCVICGSTTHPLGSLSAEQGGAVCIQCKGKVTSAMAVTPAVLKLLRALQQIDLRRLGNIQISGATREKLQQFIRTYMDIHLQVRWKSREFIDQLHRLQFDMERGRKTGKTDDFDESI